MSSIFTDIISARTPGHILWEDEHCYCLLNPKPVREGHVLMVPRQEIDHWDDMPEPLAAHVFVVAQRISRVLRSIFPCIKTGMMIGGLEVRHAHVHLLPIKALSDLDFSQAQQADEEAQRLTANRIREALASSGYQQAAPSSLP